MLSDDLKNTQFEIHLHEVMNEMFEEEADDVLEFEELKIDVDMSKELFI